MLILRIRQAEVALHDGRLDEAFELMQPTAVRSHRRGQDVLGKLVRALVQRGRTHLLADRVTQAQADCGKGEQLGGNLPDVAELRGAISNAVIAQQRNARKRALAFAAAREHIERGRLAAGEQLLANFGSTSLMESRAAVLMQDLTSKKAAVESALRNAMAAIERDDTESAARELLHARDADAADIRVIELAAKVSDLLEDRAVDAINSGRLDMAEPLVVQLSRLSHGEASQSEVLAKTLQHCRAAWSHLEHGEFGEAGEILRRLATIHISAKWIAEAVKLAQQADDATRELRTGPLGLLGVHPDASTGVPNRGPGASPVLQAAQARHGRGVRATDETLPSKFVIRVDGAGSFLVLRQPVVTIGPVSSSRIPDVGLLADASSPLAMIERSDDDYFFRSESAAATINDRPAGATTGKLLNSGDRIALSPRCRMSFAIPNLASATAVIDLTGSRFPRADVRRVILLDRDLILGAGSATHVRVDDAEGNVVLHLRDGRLFCEAKLPVEVNGAPLERTSGIPLGAHVKIGAVSFVLTRE